MTAIVDHVAVVESWMETVGEPVAAGSDKAAGIAASLIGQIAGERIAEFELQSARVALFYVRREIVVVALRSVVHALQNAPDRKWAGITGHDVADRLRGNLVEVFHGFEILAVDAGVRQAQAGAQAAGPFGRQI